MKAGVVMAGFALFAVLGLASSTTLDTEIRAALDSAAFEDGFNHHTTRSRRQLHQEETSNSNGANTGSYGVYGGTGSYNYGGNTAVNSEGSRHLRFRRALLQDSGSSGSYGSYGGYGGGPYGSGNSGRHRRNLLQDAGTSGSYGGYGNYGGSGYGSSGSGSRRRSLLQGTDSSGSYGGYGSYGGGSYGSSGTNTGGNHRRALLQAGSYGGYGGYGGGSYGSSNTNTGHHRRALLQASEGGYGGGYGSNYGGSDYGGSSYGGSSYGGGYSGSRRLAQQAAGFMVYHSGEPFLVYQSEDQSEDEQYQQQEVSEGEDQGNYAVLGSTREPPSNQDGVMQQLPAGQCYCRFDYDFHRWALAEESCKQDLYERCQEASSAEEEHATPAPAMSKHETGFGWGWGCPSTSIVLKILDGVYLIGCALIILALIRQAVTAAVKLVKGAAVDCKPGVLSVNNDESADRLDMPASCGAAAGGNGTKSAAAVHSSGKTYMLIGGTDYEKDIP
eukprot:gene11220-11369_t